MSKLNYWSATEVDSYHMCTLKLEIYSVTEAKSSVA